MNSGIRGSGKWEQEGSRSGQSVVPVLTKSITRVWSCDCRNNDDDDNDDDNIGDDNTDVSQLETRLFL